MRNAIGFLFLVLVSVILSQPAAASTLNRSVASAASISTAVMSSKVLAAPGVDAGAANEGTGTALTHAAGSDASSYGPDGGEPTLLLLLGAGLLGSSLLILRKRRAVAA